MAKEPIVYVNAVTALLVALFTLAALFGLDLSEQTKAAVITGAGSIVTALVILTPMLRQLVWAPESVDEVVAETARDGEIVTLP